MSSILPDMPKFLPGWVWLTGAGPGDPGLLTLLAAHALAHADYVVYDALVDERVLQLANRNAVLEFAGKRGGKPSPRQADISLRLVQLARQGARVLRLKGGDPFVFGRGGEEALSLVAADIPFRILPGISAGIGGLAYAGIPVTHRDVNSVVTFLTGHSSSGLVPDDIDWASIAKGSPVLVMYMALKHLKIIRSHLLAGGRQLNEPMAIVSHATLDCQQVLETTLGRCLEDLTQVETQPPAIIVLGEAVRLRAGLDWLGALAGRKLNATPLGLSRDSEAS